MNRAHAPAVTNQPPAHPNRDPLPQWTRRNTLRFPSFLQELAAIRALPPRRPISESLQTLLTYLARALGLEPPAVHRP